MHSVQASSLAQQDQVAVRDAHAQVARGGQRRVLFQRGLHGDRVELEVARRPDRLDVGDGAAAGDVAPRAHRAGLARGLVGQREADHAAQVVADQQLEDRGRGRALEGDVVGVVQHRREVAEHGRHRGVPVHVPLVAGAEERHRLLQEAEQRAVAVGQRAHRLHVFGLALDRLGDEGRIAGVEVAAPERLVADRLDDQPLELLGVLGLGAQKPRLGRRGARAVEVGDLHVLKELFDGARGDLGPPLSIGSLCH
ncbi:hypothetical protein [Nannocystis pusilla]|uniref:hypothetical protein n=1 Tax=Nannocystis pusilla TaxID=889268 RepID=UPI003DA1DFF1